MAKAAREIVPDVESAGESRRVRITARPADDVTAHTKCLARPTVAASARKRVEPCSLSVGIGGARRPRPPGRMGVPTRRALTRDAETRVAIDAEELAVAGDALAWVRRSLLVVDRDEVGSVHGVAHRFVESEARGNRRHRNAVARRALALGVAAGAEIALRVGLHPMLSEEVAVVNYVTLGHGHLARQVDVTSTAVPGRPLSFVRMAAETGWVLDPNIVRVDRDVDVTSDAVAGFRLDVRCV